MNRTTSQAGDQQADHRWGERIAPAETLDEPGGERQEDQLSGRRTRGQHAEHEAAPRGEPARRNDRAEHQRRHAGADADDDPPQDDEMPGLGHDKREQQAGDDHRDGDDDDAAHAIALDQGGGERRHQPEQDKADRQRARNLSGVPAEFLGQRQDQRAGHADRAGGGQRGEEGDGDDHPAVMNAIAGKPQRKRVCQHQGAPSRIRLLRERRGRLKFR